MRGSLDEPDGRCNPSRNLSRAGSRLSVTRVGGGAGQHQIDHFAFGTSTANGHVASSDVLISGNLDSGVVSFSGVRPEAVLSLTGLEMASDYVVLEDTVVAVADAESDTISRWSVDALVVCYILKPCPER